MSYSGLSERFASSTKLGADGKPVALCFGWVCRDGVFTPGLLFVNERVKARKLTFRLYEPGDDEKPVKSAIKLGEVEVKLTQHLQVTGVGTAYNDLILAVLEQRYEP